MIAGAAWPVGGSARAVRAARIALAVLGALAIPAVVVLLSACQAAQPRQALGVIATQPARCADPALQGAARGTSFLTESAWQAHLAGLDGELRSSLWSWRVDFRAGQSGAGESVVLASSGPQPNPGYRIAIEEGSLRVRDQVLQVRLAIVPPPADAIQAQVISFACLYIRLDGATYREVAVQVPR